MVTVEIRLKSDMRLVVFLVDFIHYENDMISFIQRNNRIHTFKINDIDMWKAFLEEE